MKLCAHKVSILVFIPVAVFLVALSAYGYLGLFARYRADDYCTAAVLAEKGFVASQQHWYLAWSGRFSFTLVINLVELVGVKIVPFLPSIILVLWLGGLVWAVHQVSLLINLPSPKLLAFVLGGLIVFATLDSAPDIIESFYWQTGSITYTVPLIVLTFYGGFIAYRLRHANEGKIGISWLAASAVIAFAAGGFSETVVVFQTGAFLAAIVLFTLFVPNPRKRFALFLLSAGLVGSVLAMMIIYFAPGTSIRQALLPPSPDLVSAVASSIKDAGDFVIRTFMLSRPVTLLLILILPAILAFNLHLRQPVQSPNLSVLAQVFGSIALLGLLLVVICFGPVNFVGYYLPGRLFIIPLFVLVCIIVCEGYLAGFALSQTSFFRRRSEDHLYVLSLGMVIMLLAFGPIVSIRRTFAYVPMVRTFAQMWDYRDQKIREAKQQGVMDLVVPRIPFSEILGDFGADPDHWVNNCAADYYGLNSIATE